MKLKTQKRMTGKAAVAAALLGATLILPGTAVADHNPNNNRDPYTCDPAVADECPHFEASAFFRVQNPVKNQSSAVNFEFSQPDRRMPVMLANYYLPTGWRFGGLSNLDAAVQGPDDPVPGAPATSCGQIYNSNGSLQNAELLSAGTGMLIHRNGRRGDNPTDDEEVGTAVEEPVFGPGGVLLAEFDAGPVDYGYQPTDPNPNDANVNRRFPSVAFLSWDGTTANLCYLHRNNEANERNPLPVDFRNSANLTKLAGDPNFDWRVSLSLANVYDDPGAIAQRANILRHNVELGSLTAGNWTRHPVTGELQKVAFSRTPLDPGNYPFRAELFTCAEGLDPAHPTGCENGTFSAPIIVNQVIPITPAPDVFTYDFGKLSGPVTPALCSNAVCPLGLIRGSSTINVTWSQPALVDGQEVRGYALTLAIPGNQNSRKFYRLVTDPSTLGFDPSVCGPAGGDPNCEFQINLPVQSTDGSTTLTPDKKYHVALVTIYDDGRRTDLKCDELTGEGMACPPGTPRMRLTAETGISTWQILMRPEAWPRAFVATLDDTSNTTHDPITNYTLLLDCNLKEAEFVVWNTNDKVASFRAFSNLILCSNEPFTPGIVEFNNGTSAGATRNWVFAGELDPPIPGSGVTGVFASYDVKNPGLNPPTIAGWPEIGQPGCETFDCFFFFAGEI